MQPTAGFELVRGVRLTIDRPRDFRDTNGIFLLMPGNIANGVEASLPYPEKNDKIGKL
jgi:hypothetical protein